MCPLKNNGTILITTIIRFCDVYVRAKERKCAPKMHFYMIIWCFIYPNVYLAATDKIQKKITKAIRIHSVFS